MFFNDKNQKLEQDILKNHLAFQELLIQMDGMNEEIGLLLTELNVTRNQLQQYLSNPHNFTEENWQELQKQRKLLDDKLSREIDNVRDPRKAKKSQNERNIQQHWLFVK